MVMTCLVDLILSIPLGVMTIGLVDPLCCMLCAPFNVQKELLAR